MRSRPRSRLQGAGLSLQWQASRWAMRGTHLTHQWWHVAATHAQARWHATQNWANAAWRLFDLGGPHMTTERREAPRPMTLDFPPITADLAAVRAAVQTVLVGQDAVLDGVLLALLTGGHVFLEGVPGVGKTLLIKTLAGCLDAIFARVQCTPDLNPLDLLGTADDPGPVWAHLLLMDEINRATPRFQSALLEAMQERQVTYAGTPRPLPTPFVVLATQNPLESEGTYPLPEAQLDRFFLKLLVPRPPPEELTEILRRTTAGSPPAPECRFRLDDVRRWQATVRAMPVPPWLLQQAVTLVSASHPDDPTAPPAVRRYVLYGSSPRGGQALILGAKALACLTGEPLSPTHVAAVAPAALRHRLCLNFTGAAGGITPDDVVDALLATATPRREA